MGAVSSPGSGTRRMFRISIRGGRETVSYDGRVEAVDSSRFDTLVQHGYVDWRFVRVLDMARRVSIRRGASPEQGDEL